MIRVFAKVAGLAVTVMVWVWALNGQRSDAWNMAMIWGAPLFVFPVTVLGRRALDAKPGVRRAEWITIPVHYAMGIALGVALLPGFQLLLKQPTLTTPVVRQLVSALVALTGVATFLSVLNLAVRGFGAPFAAKLSSRLATDWMYAWTRNPMVLCVLAWFLSLGLWHGSAWGVLWIAVSVAPELSFFVRTYEERELEIRFGSSYAEYRARTPFLWPRRPRPPRGSSSVLLP